MTDSGGSQTNLTNNSLDDWGPTWSPDGTRIAFASYRNNQNRIWVMNQDGSGQTQLNSTSNSFELSWSPDRDTDRLPGRAAAGGGWAGLMMIEAATSSTAAPSTLRPTPKRVPDACVRSSSPDQRIYTFSRLLPFILVPSVLVFDLQLTLMPTMPPDDPCILPIFFQQLRLECGLAGL